MIVKIVPKSVSRNMVLAHAVVPGIVVKTDKERFYLKTALTINKGLPACIFVDMETFDIVEFDRDRPVEICQSELTIKEK